MLTLLIEALRAFSRLTLHCTLSLCWWHSVQDPGRDNNPETGTAGWRCEGHSLGMQVLKDEDGRDAI